jgi:signal transduction histidine kinase
MTQADVNFTWSGMIAHDLKNPVGSVLLALDIIQHIGPLNERQMTNLQRAIATLNRMTVTIDRMLDMASLENLALVEQIPVDMVQIAQQSADQMSVVAQQRNVRFEFDAGVERYMVMGDPVLLGQLMDNLMGNAVKYNHNDGAVKVGFHQDPGVLHVSVQDDGPGIAPEDLDHVFEAFFRSEEMRKRKLSGSGLGLAIAKGIVDRHQGRIWVESTLGSGATFHVTLPLAALHENGEYADSEGAQVLGESDERDLFRNPDHVSEERDVVDDAIQEKRELHQVDSVNDQS